MHYDTEESLHKPQSAESFYSSFGQWHFKILKQWILSLKTKKKKDLDISMFK